MYHTYRMVILKPSPYIVLIYGRFKFYHIEYIVVKKFLLTLVCHVVELKHSIFVSY